MNTDRYCVWCREKQIYTGILVEGKSSLLEYQSVDWKMSLNYHRLMGCEILEWIGAAEKMSASELWL
jgi:hypothetical protein